MDFLDIISHFISISTDFTCMVIEEIWPNYGSATDISKETIIELVRFCISSNCFTFGEGFFSTDKQYGNEFNIISCDCGNRNLIYREDKIIYKLDAMLKFWQKYTEVVFIVSKNEDLSEILAVTNLICPSIQFTTEKETNY